MKVKIFDKLPIIVTMIFYIGVTVAVGLIAWSVLKYTFTTGDIVVLLFLIVFFMSLKYD